MPSGRIISELRQPPDNQHKRSFCGGVNVDPPVFTIFIAVFWQIELCPLMNKCIFLLLLHDDDDEHKFVDFVLVDVVVVVVVKSFFIWFKLDIIAAPKTPPKYEEHSNWISWVGFVCSRSCIWKNISHNQCQFWGVFGIVCMTRARTGFPGSTANEWLFLFCFGIDVFDGIGGQTIWSLHDTEQVTTHALQFRLFNLTSNWISLHSYWLSNIFRSLCLLGFVFIPNFYFPLKLNLHFDILL